MATKATIITLTYNKKDLIVNLARSLKDKCHDFEWLICDNGTDDTADALKAEGFGVIKHDNSGNFSSQNNIISQYANSDVLIFLNNDMIATSDFVSDMVEVLDKNPDVGAVGACLRYEEGGLQHGGVVFSPNLVPGNLGSQAILDLKLDIKWETPEAFEGLIDFQAVTGACLAMRRTDFMQLRGFDPLFHWCFDDVDLCLRVRMWLGKRCVVSPKSTLMHLESQSGGNRRVKENWDLFRGRYLGHVFTDLHCFR